MALTGYKTNSYPYIYQLIKITSNSTRLRGYWKKCTGWVGLRNAFSQPNYDQCREAVDKKKLIGYEISIYADDSP